VVVTLSAVSRRLDLNGARHRQRSSQAKRGEIIEIKTLAAHPMETGFAAPSFGELIPRDIIRRFVCT